MSYVTSLGGVLTSGVTKASLRSRVLEKVKEPSKITDSSTSASERKRGMASLRDDLASALASEKSLGQIAMDTLRKGLRSDSRVSG